MDGRLERKQNGTEQNRTEQNNGWKSEQKSKAALLQAPFHLRERHEIEPTEWAL